MHTSGQNLSSGSRQRFHRRYHAWVGLPENPLCWLLGHRPRVRVQDPRYSRPYVVQDCRVCVRRYQPDRLDVGIVERLSDRRGQDRATFLREQEARRVEVARRDPRMVESGMERRGHNWPVRQWEGGVEAVVPRRLRPEFSLRLHVGTRASETPYDAHLTVGGAGVYLQTSGLTGRWAERLTRGQGRDLSLSLHRGTLRWRLWTAEGHCNGPEHNHWQGDRYRPWLCREGNAPAHPLDWVQGGRPTGSHVALAEPVEVDVLTAEGTGPHRVRFTLQEWTWKRPRGPVLKRWREAEWWCQEGIPTQNHDWKGDETLGSSVQIPQGMAADPGNVARWTGAATVALIAQVRDMRKRSAWRPRATA